MSCQLPVIGSATSPVQEVIADNENGLLVDFFDSEQLAFSINELLRDRPRAEALGLAARNTILQKYSLDTCLPQQLALLQLVASKRLP